MFMTKDQIKKMFIYMGYDLDMMYTHYMPFSNMGKYWRIDYVDNDMELKSYAEFNKTGNDLKDRKRYIEYYKHTKKVNEYRSYARKYNKYCTDHFDKRIASDISANDLYNAVIKHNDKLKELNVKLDNDEITLSEFEEELNNIGTIGYKVRMFSNGMGIGGFDLFSACAYASGDSKLNTMEKKPKFVRVVNALHNWYVNYYSKNEIQMNYYA